jgi:peptidoglycan/LPS O-acetylase OafA/YrhL
MNTEKPVEKANNPSGGAGEWDNLLRSGHNSFDVVRLALATMVVLEHSYFLIDNRVERDPLNVLSNGQTNSGALAVAMFFSISGFLVTMSAIRSRSIPDYLLRRLARIAPGFWAASFLGLAIVGPLAATNLSRFFSDQNWKALIVQALMLRQANPGATLESNPIHLVHGTLWTIKLEFDCYLIIAAIALLLTSRFVPYVYAGIAAILGLSIVFATHLPQINYGVLSLLTSSPSDWPGLFPFFFVGSAFYTFRHRVKKSSGLATICAVAISLTFVAGGAWWALLFCGTYLCLFIALSTTSAIRIFNARVDLSYGVYLYGWPVQQLVLHYFGIGIGPWPLFSLSMLLTLPVAYLSWHFVENPVLRLAGSRRDG